MYRLAEEADYGNYHVYYLYSYKPFYHTMYAICVHTPINMKMACISMYIFHHLTKKMPKSPKSSPPENAK